MQVTKESLDLTQRISDEIGNQTFHHHYHILFDLANSYDPTYEITYVEIGCYAGGSACLMLQRPNTRVISIDLGDPISPDVVIENVNRLNIHKNQYDYIQGDSQVQETEHKLKQFLGDKKIDILFIDGDHSFNGVINDFNIYNKYVNQCGYIVFDDYNDEEHSPEVKLAVDSLNLSDYQILGEFGNEFGARPNDIKANEYVIKKLGNIESIAHANTKDIKIGIVISTYYRPDGKTKFYLDRCLNSLKNQTYKNFKVFLIGDKYENEDEFRSFSSYFDDMYMENLKIAKEREKYTNYRLWCTGGVNAMNVGIKVSLSKGYNWIINMDHDDYLSENHLKEIVEIINSEDPVFVCSKSTYEKSVLPKQNTKNFIPMAGGLIKSSACVDFSVVNLLFRDVYEEEGRDYPSDADFWDRLKVVIQDNRYQSFCTCNLTCFHDEEGYAIKMANTNPKIMVDVFMLTNTKNGDYFNITKDAINSLRISQRTAKFNILLIETNLESDYNNMYSELGCSPILFNDKFSFSKAINYAMRHGKNKYALITNNDVKFTTDWFEEIYKYLKLENVGVWSTFDPNLNFSIDNRTDVIEGYKPCGIHSGWCYLVDTEKINSEKFLSEEFDVWFMDDDFCMRLQNLGIKQVLCKNSKVYHLNGASNELRDDFDLRVRQDRSKFIEKYNGHIRIHSVQFLETHTILNFESFGYGLFEFIITGDVNYRTTIDMIPDVYYYISVEKSNNVNLVVLKDNNVIFRSNFKKLGDL